MSTEQIQQTRRQTSSLDLFDRRILAILQLDASLTIAEIARRVGMSQTPCWRRIQRLETDGIILRRTAIPDPLRLGLAVTVIAHVTLADHTPINLQAIADFIAERDEIVEAHRLAGQFDYILQVVVPHLEAYEQVYAALTARVPVKAVQSQIALQTVKLRAPYPV